ncbi:MAG: hypothetical protein R3F20_07890 [Planctomycetota bacterium]
MNKSGLTPFIQTGEGGPDHPGGCERRNVHENRDLVGDRRLALAGCGNEASAPEVDVFAEFRGDEELARTAVQAWAARGEAAIPTLREGLRSDSIKVQHGCRRALALITGQWGWDDGLVWRRSVAEASGGDRPLMVLHLFGAFDEEFC